MDWEKLVSTQRLGQDIIEFYNLEENDGKYEKGEIEKDYHRIILSASFRRLQDKTQVFPLDKSDFVRTRLTHSLETSSYARTLGKMVGGSQNQYGIESRMQQTDSQVEQGISGNISEILMCAGLLHDIGNPPFGHFGENIIASWFQSNLDNEKYSYKGKPMGACLTEHMKRDLCNFEGNAQGLRLITKLHFLDSDYGLNLTASVLNTVIKYPTSSLHKDPNAKNIIYKKLGYFLADEEVYREIALKAGTLKEGEPLSAGRRHPLTYLLEAADDIAYITADLEDGYKKGLFTFDQFTQFVQERQSKYKKQMNEAQRAKTKRLFDELDHYKKTTRKTENGLKKKVEDIELHAFQNWLLYVRDWLMFCAAFGFTKNYDAILEGTYEHHLLVNTFHEYSKQILFDVLKEFVFKSSQIVKLELAAQTILNFLLDKFVPAILYYNEGDADFPSVADRKLISLISKNYKKAYEIDAMKYNSNSPEDEAMRLYLRLLLITDFISGMTDTYAKTMYQELSGIY